MLGNVSTILGHRRNVPDSAELVAQTAGTEETWSRTQQTQSAIIAQMPTGHGSRRRGHEYIYVRGEIEARLLRAEAPR